MTSFSVTIGSANATAVLDNPAADFAAKFCAAAELNHLARCSGRPLDHAALDSLVAVLLSRRFAGQRQRLFLYREAADTLARTAVRWKAAPPGIEALARLGRALMVVDGYAHRAVSEALGALPVQVAGPQAPPAGHQACPVAHWPALLAAGRLRTAGPPAWKGRSLIVPVTDGLLVLKFARPGQDSTAGLQAERWWMEHLAGQRYRFRVPFAVPRPLGCLKVAGLPWRPPAGFETEITRPALAYLAHPDYFSYPNTGPAGPGFAAMQRSLEHSAWLLGYLAGQGVIHTSPIALFHNRVQRRRRRDQGRYEWFRAGRLDRWLESCRYPNLALCGLRDLEHLESIAGPGLQLYRHLGAHLLSLLLVAASWFRNRRPELAGRDGRGRPVDARRLFDRDLLEKVVREIFRRYHEGFTGLEYRGRLPFDAGHLAARMVEEMGVDRHMEEVLRVADQNRMTSGQLEDFLVGRGYGRQEAAAIKKGAADIVIISGPHLGGFNRPISLPEMIQAVAAAAAVCIAGRFRAEGGLPAGMDLADVPVSPAAGNG